MSQDERLLERLRQHCLAKPGTSEEMPFDDRTVVFKVGGKVFCLLDAFEFSGCGMKCDPERIPELRASYEGITTGPYINAKHWNSVHPSRLATSVAHVPRLGGPQLRVGVEGLTRKVKAAIEET